MATTRILFKNRVVAFYPEQRTVVKFFPDIEAQNAHMDGIKSGSEAFTFLKVPKILDAGNVTMPFIIHPMITGKKPNARLMRGRLNNIVQDIAALHGNSLQSSPIIHPLQAVNDALMAAESEGLAVSPKLHFFLSELPFTSVLRANCHGDFRLGNMIGKNPPYVLDWDTFGSSLVVRDLLDIGDESVQPRVYATYAEILRVQYGFDITPELLHSQAVLYLLSRLSLMDNTYFETYYARSARPERYQVNKQRILARAENHLQFAAITS